MHRIHRNFMRFKKFIVFASSCSALVTKYDEKIINDWTCWNTYLLVKCSRNIDGANSAAVRVDDETKGAWSSASLLIFCLYSTNIYKRHSVCECLFWFVLFFFQIELVNCERYSLSEQQVQLTKKVLGNIKRGLIIQYEDNCFYAKRLCQSRVYLFSTFWALGTSFFWNREIELSIFFWQILAVITR